MTKKGILSKIGHSTGAAVLRLRVRSALNPSLWLCGIVTIPALSIAAFIPAPLQIPLVVLAFLPVCIFGISALYLLVKDRDKLQSEDYQVQKRALELIEQKGGVIPMEAASIQVITKPEFARLPAGGDLPDEE